MPASDPTSRRFEITLTEGRNRQIRRMCEALGLQVVSLHRTTFAGIGLKGLARGNWAELDEAEMGLVQRALGVGEREQRGQRGDRREDGEEEEEDEWGEE